MHRYRLVIRCWLVGIAGVLGAFVLPGFYDRWEVKQAEQAAFRLWALTHSAREGIVICGHRTKSTWEFSFSADTDDRDPFAPRVYVSSNGREISIGRGGSK